MKKKVLIIVPVAVALAVVLYIAHFLVIRGKYAHKELQQISFYESRDIEGSSRSLNICMAEDGKALLSEKIKDEYYQTPVVNEWYVSEKIIDDIEKLFMKNNLFYGEKRKNLGMSFVDGGAWEISFVFDNGMTGYSSYKKISGREQKAKDEILNIIDGYMLNGEHLAKLKSEPITAEEWDNITHPNDGVFAVRIKEYEDNALKIVISNGTEDRVIYDHSYKIFKSGESRPMIRVNGKYEDELVRNSYSEDLLRLEERLEPGEYILEILGQKIEFEIE